MAPFASDMSISGADVESSIPTAVAGANVIVDAASGADTSSMCQSSGLSSTSSLQTASHQPITPEENNTY